MRCYACQKILSSSESVRKFKSGEYTDMCTKCLSTIEDTVDVAEDSYDSSADAEDTLQN